MKLTEALQWRYATKKMNGEKVSEEKLERILDAIRLAPSSIGLQPYNIIVVSDPDLLKQIAPVANDQPQIAGCSHLLVFAAWDNVTQERADAFVSLNSRVRNVPADSLTQVKGYMANIVARNAEANFAWAARQAYIALGVGVAAAALEQVDATPMEGFKAPMLDELLGLGGSGLRSVTIMPLGYRDAANDWLAPLNKVRWDKEELFIRK